MSQLTATRKRLLRSSLKGFRGKMLVLGNKTKWAENRQSGFFLLNPEGEKTNKSLANSEWGCRQPRVKETQRVLAFLSGCLWAARRHETNGRSFNIKACVSLLLFGLQVFILICSGFFMGIIITQHGLERLQQTNLLTLKYKNKTTQQDTFFLLFTRSYFSPHKQFFLTRSAPSLCRCDPVRLALPWAEFKAPFTPRRDCCDTNNSS